MRTPRSLIGWTMATLGLLVLALLSLPACDSAKKCHTLKVTRDDGKTTTYQVSTSGQRIRVKLVGDQLNVELPKGHSEDFKGTGQSAARSLVTKFKTYDCR